MTKNFARDKLTGSDRLFILSPSKLRIFLRHIFWKHSIPMGIFRGVFVMVSIKFWI